jgi:hypothetical protein
MAAITLMRSVTMGQPRTQIALYGCRWENPLIAASAQGHEPQDRSSGERERFAARP